MNAERGPDPAPRPDTISELLANRPFIICVLYLCTYFTGFSCVVGAVLAYVFKDGQTEEWEETHYLYLIRTFWMLATAFVIALIAGFALAIAIENIVGGVLFGLLFFAVLVLLAARTVYAMIYAVKRKPIPRPRTFLL